MVSNLCFASTSPRRTSTSGLGLLLAYGGLLLSVIYSLTLANVAAVLLGWHDAQMIIMTESKGLRLLRLVYTLAVSH